MEIWRTFLSRDNGSCGPSNISTSSFVKCPSNYQIYHTMWAATELISAIVGFLCCGAVLWETVQRHMWSDQQGHGSSSNSSSSSDLLMVNLNLIGIFNCTTQFFHAVSIFPKASHLLPQLTAALSMIGMTGGLFSMVSICLDCYLAVVHPLRYTHLRTRWRHPLILTAFIWLYTVIMEAIVIGRQLPHYDYIGIITFYVTMPAIFLLNVSTLYALWLAGPGQHRLADLSPTKRRAFWLVLSILLGNVTYLLPQIILLTYWALTKTEQASFICVVFPMVMMFPTMVSALISLLFVYTQTPVKRCVIKH